MSNFHLRQSGVSLIEVMMAMAIISSLVIAIGWSITTYVDARSALLNDVKNVYLAEEGYEIIRALRDDDWNTIDALTVGDTHYLDVSTSTIAIGGGPEVIDGEFYRSFVLTEVYRDSNDDVTASTTPGALVDTEILEVKVSVFGPTGTTSLSALVSNLHAI
jgi:prepilin-type N-terminal cleavage/methylation domain-containing protein